MRLQFLMSFLLQNLLTSNPGLAAVFASKEWLIPLFECLALHVPAESNIPQICLSVLSLLTKHAPCLEAMVAERTSLILLFQILRCNPPCRDGALAVLYSLASTPELAWAAAKHGGVVYILELMLPLQGVNFTLINIWLLQLEIQSKVMSSRSVHCPVSRYFAYFTCLIGFAYTAYLVLVGKIGWISYAYDLH
jgi:hypothetical protein